MPPTRGGSLAGRRSFEFVLFALMRHVTTTHLRPRFHQSAARIHHRESRTLPVTASVSLSLLVTGSDNKGSAKKDKQRVVNPPSPLRQFLTNPRQTPGPPVSRDFPQTRTTHHAPRSILDVGCWMSASQRFSVLAFPPSDYRGPPRPGPAPSPPSRSPFKYPFTSSRSNRTPLPTLIACSFFCLLNSSTIPTECGGSRCDEGNELV